MTYPEDLRIADMLEAGNHGYQSRAAAELRRLYEENQRCRDVCAATAEGWRVERDALLEALKEIVDAADGTGWDQLDASFSKARVAIAKAEETA